MSEEKTLDKRSPVSMTALVTALVFGVIALIIVLAGLHLPIPGTGVVTDPRELFTTIGAALSGPVGGVLIGILAGVAEPAGIQMASLLGHIVGCVWMGFAYKKLAYERLQMPAKLLGWVGLILVYYYVLVVPGFLFGMALFHKEIFVEFFGEMTLLQAYGPLASGAVWESILTAVITALAMAALPRKYQRPLW